MYNSGNQIVSLDYPLGRYIANTYDGQISDLNPGIEMGQGYYGIEAAAADDCCPCECNCDIFTERFKVRTGATDPSNIELDRKDARVWTKSGSITLGVRSYPPDPADLSIIPTGECAIFSSGGGSLRSETKPVRGNDFCTGINFNFGTAVSGQQAVLKYGTLEAVMTLVVTTGAFPTYKIQGTLTGAPNMVEYDLGTAFFSFADLIFNAVLFIKDGYASLVIAVRESIITTGQLTRVTSGITSFSTVNPGQDYVSVEGRSLAGEMRLFAFNIQNHLSDVKYRCQKRYFGTEDAVTDYYPSSKYKLDFHYGHLGLDFSVVTELGLSKNTTVTIPSFGGGAQSPASCMRYTGRADGAFDGTAAAPGVGNPQEIKIDLNFTGYPESVAFFISSSMFFYSLGVGAMVSINHYIGAFPGGYVTETFFSGDVGGKIHKWYGNSRSMGAVRLYPGSILLGSGSGAPDYDPTQNRWVDVTSQ